MSKQHRLRTPEEISLFMFAGNATLTLRSAKTGQRFTYKVQEDEKDPALFWVKVLVGPDNWTNYKSLGRIKAGEYIRNRNSGIGEDAPSARAFAWFAGNLLRNVVREELEVYHEGKCGACGRKLTVPESILTGLGPECSDRIGVPRVRCETVSPLELALA
jgi:hypothetical protein